MHGKVKSKGHPATGRGSPRGSG